MFKSITLEMSLKPFKQNNEEYIRQVVKDMFLQWRGLLKNRETISVLLWVGDGSEILDYGGNLSDNFEYAKFIGTANVPLWKEGDYEFANLHERKREYMKNAPVFTYAILKKIVNIIKEEGGKIFPNSKIRVGETFDIGPEFAISDFKYKRHREICSGMELDSFGFLDATALLNGDDRSYSSYPNGIPNGLPFGTFLGKQCNVFLKDMDFDYIWLSNGVGYSREPWSMTGKVFDGENFFPEKLEETKNGVFKFWKFFREACPDYPIETRGTNNSVGIDYATDGVPLYDIYNANLNILPPPNSPWAAINDDVGLELAGHMTRICGIPSDKYMFRYYLHDIWWCNSPWYDRYRKSPFDIYLPMAVSFIDENGNVKTPTDFAILSVDNSFGKLPDSCANEPLPHMLLAEKNAPDKISDFVWVYPFKEFTQTKDVNMLKEMYYGDLFICKEINNAFPLSTVVSVDNFMKHDLSIYKGKTLIYPAVNSKAVSKLKDFVKMGGNVITYGYNDKNKKDFDAFRFVDIKDDKIDLKNIIKEFGYYIEIKKDKGIKNPCIMLSKNNNASVFSVYNRNLTAEVLLKFPLGVPILTNTDVKIVEGKGVYHFARGEQKSCRAFVEQKDGIISMFEYAPVSANFRRILVIEGLKDATVYFFPEEYCKENCYIAKNKDYETSNIANSCQGVNDSFDTAFKCVEDENGTYYKCKHVNGTRYFMMPFKN